ncbi:MAG TPA: cytochrome D1 domain-containing protein [Thermoanaerobaculia bacterium]|nr:cytochrome D1 domain-containing protein [Thermoanaerobaculia bacterium]
MSSQTKKHGRRPVWILAAAFAVAGAGWAQEAAKPRSPEPPAQPGPATRTQKVVKEGIAVELEIEPLQGDVLMEGEYARVRLKFSDTATGTPLAGIYPGGWMDRVGAKPGLVEGEEGTVDCKKKVESFLSGSILSRPQLDLNVYYVLALNQDATISVVDPLFGYGTSKLLTMVFLKSPGEDWVVTEDGNRLFVSMPDVDKVAVIETAGWKVVKEIDTAAKPRRVGLQPDGQYLWVTTDAGVTVIDARSLEKVADIATGKGGHDLVISDDSRSVFVTNEGEGTVSVIDVAKLAEVRDVPTGGKPVSIAWSALAKAAYVVDTQGGTITALNADSPKPLASIKAGPGVGRIRFAPGGRLAFVVHPNEDTVHLIDAASNRLVQTADVEDEPDQVSFSDELAYVRHKGSEIVLMIPLKTVGQEGTPVPVVDFPGGQKPPGRLPRPTPADGIVQAPGATAVLVANAEDKAIYYYKEGMAAPMGHFQNYGKHPRAVLVVDRSLKEVRPGTYETVTQMSRAGDYEVALFVDSPRLIHCFPVKLAENPTLAAARKLPLSIEVATEKNTVNVGEAVAVRFKLTDPENGQARKGLKDVRVLTFLSPGIWQQRHWANEVGEGLYEIHFTPPESGVYFVFVEVASQGMPFQKSPFLVLTAQARPDAAAQKSGSGR